MAAAPLSRIGGYEVLEKLGEGGMGVVYKARQLDLNRVVALKVILAAHHASAEARARFRTEAEALARLDHPHIVTVYHVGEEAGAAGGWPFLVMEFCPGGSLERKLRGTPLVAAEAARLVEQLARAVQAAHRQQVVHRDLKPENVLLGADGQPRISDFGLARLLDREGTTRTDAVLGTPSYMSPEQASGRTSAAGPSADIYALGAILYECLTGRPPFKAATAVDTVLQVVQTEPVPPRQLTPGVPRDLDTICLKCLQKDPGKRYASAEDLADDLAAFREGRAIKARPVGLLGRAAKWVRRQPGVAALLAALVLALVAGTAVSTYFALAAQRRAEEAEAALVEGILRPVGGPQAPGTAEVDALWQLAGLPSDRLRLRVLEGALASPEGTRRAARRADMLVHAAVGLSPARKARLGEALRACLRKPSADPHLRLARVRLGAALLEDDPAFIDEAARTAEEATTQAADLKALTQVAADLKALAPRLGRRAEGRLAVALAGKVVAHMEQMDNPRVLAALTDACAALLAGQEGAEPRRLAEALAGKLLKELPKSDHHRRRVRLAQALAVVSTLHPPRNGGLAPTLIEHLVAARNPDEVEALAEATTRVIGRDGDAALRARALAGAETLRGRLPDVPAAQALSSARALAALVGCLDERERHRQVRMAVQELHKRLPREDGEAGALGRALVPLVRLLPCEEQRATLLDLIAQAARLSRTTQQRGPSGELRCCLRVPLLDVIQAVAGGLSPADGEVVARTILPRMAGEAALPCAVDALAVQEVRRRGKVPGLHEQAARVAAGLAERLARGDRAEERPLRMLAVMQLAGDLDMPAAAVAVEQMIEDFAGGKRLEVDAGGSPQAVDLLEGVVRAAPRLDRRSAARAAGRLVEALGGPRKPAAPGACCTAFLALAGQMDRAEARPLAARVVLLLVGAMLSRTEVGDLERHADAIVAVSGKLGSADPFAAHRRQAEVLAGRVVERLGPNARPRSVLPFARVLAALAEKGAGKHARAAAGQLAANIRAAPQRERRVLPLARALALVAAGRLTKSQARAVRRDVVETMERIDTPADLAALAAAFLAVTDRSDEAQMAGVLARLMRGLAGATQAEDVKELAGALLRVTDLLDAGAKREHAVLIAHRLLEHRVLSGAEDGPRSNPFEVAWRNLDLVDKLARGPRGQGDGSGDGRGRTVQATQPERGAPAEEVLGEVARRLTDQQLVDLLKAPSCVGASRAVLVRLLGRRCDAEFAGLWDLVAHLRAHRPELDLDAPPRRRGR
jgi:tRNA A-37 threonylcarbamoyl transferase component Bud32